MKIEKMSNLDYLDQLSCGYQRMVAGNNGPSIKEIVIISKIVHKMETLLESVSVTSTIPLDDITKVYQRVISSDKNRNFVTESFEDLILSKIEDCIKLAP